MLSKLLIHPSEYFKNFDGATKKWLFCLLGFTITGIGESFGNISSVTRYPPISFYAGIFKSGVLTTIQNIMIFGTIWIYWGSKLFKGKADYSKTIQALGHAFLWPGLFGLGLIFSSIALFYTNNVQINVLKYIIGTVQFIMAIWGLILSAIAVKNINSFSNRKTLGVMLLYPVLLLAVFIGIIIFISFITKK